MVSNYLFSLAMGLVAIIFVYLDSLQSKANVVKTTYIKVFMAATIISLITSEFFKSPTSTMSSIATGGFNSLPNRQEILTGNPDF